LRKHETNKNEKPFFFSPFPARSFSFSRVMIEPLYYVLGQLGCWPALTTLAGLFVAALLIGVLADGNGRTNARAMARRAARAHCLRDTDLTDMAKKLEELEREGTMPNAIVRTYIATLSAAGLWRAMHDETLPRDQRLSCRTIMLHYIARALDAQDKYSCLAQVRFAEALEDATKVDEAIAGRRAGYRDDTPSPLEGVPLSVKDDYDQAGFDTTCGLAARCGRPLERNGLMVDLLCDAGAIPFCRTAVPQALLLPESMSAAWGRTKNPYNVARTSGGSSGGEAALLAARGSPLGICSDIGGSARNPAAFCGLYSFKATPERLSLEGTGEPNINGESGQNAIRACCAPLGHSVDDLELVLRAWLSERMWQTDVTVPRLPLQPTNQSTQMPLRIGYYTDDGYFAPSPACARAVVDAIQLLIQAGHTCVPFAPPLVSKAVGAYYECLSADNCLGMISGFEGEQPCAEYSSLLLLTRIPRWIGRFVIAPILRLVGEPRLAQLLHWSGGTLASCSFLPFTPQPSAKIQPVIPVSCWGFGGKSKRTSRRICERSSHAPCDCLRF
jgi:Asp-tRNA(Asn)/Glu-tRNA(Gln) amidotransferase A subunit family amidase